MVAKDKRWVRITEPHKQAARYPRTWRPLLLASIHNMDTFAELIRTEVIVQATVYLTNLGFDRQRLELLTIIGVWNLCTNLNVKLPLRALCFSLYGYNI